MPAIGDRSHARSLRRTPPIQQAVFLTMPFASMARANEIMHENSKNPTSQEISEVTAYLATL